MTTDGSYGPDSPDDPIVSVILANYNAAPFLEAALRSILGQSLAALEAIVVDDASTDDGPAIARRIAEQDARVRLVTMVRNGGPAAARNKGLAVARGRWIAIVDTDDLIHPRRLERLVAEAEARGADMAADDQLIFDHGSTAPPTRFLKPADRGQSFRLDLGDYLRRSVLYGPDPNPGFLKPIIRRDRLLATGIRYDETLTIAEDDDLAARLLIAGLNYVVVPEPWYFYRKHATSISHRLSLSAVQAMKAADERLARRVMDARPDLAQACAARRRALDRVLAFETFIAALKSRAFGRAARLLARRPSIAPMLRMPLAGLARKARRVEPASDAGEMTPALRYRWLMEAGAPEH